MITIKVERLDEKQKTKLDLPDSPRRQGPWSVWECAPSSFDWHYDDEEQAYLYEGQVVVSTKNGHVEIKAGDFVTFPQGLDCTWKVLKTVRKVYRFR